MLIKRILDSELVLAIIGTGGIGKTMYALEIAIRLLSGSQIPKWPKVKNFPEKIVFFSEDPEREIRWRIKKISKSLGIEVPENLIIKKPFTLNPCQSQKEGDRYCIGPELYDVIDTLEGFELLVLDTLKHFHTMDENSNTMMDLVVANIKNLSRKLSCPIIVIHHTSGSPSSENIRATSRGATTIVDDIPTVLQMSESDLSNADLLIEWKKANFRKKKPDSFNAKRKNLLIKSTDSLPDYLENLKGIQTGTKIISLIKRYEKVQSSKANLIRKELQKAGHIKRLRKNQYKIIH
jgi:RecA-family ATPase